MMGAWSSMTVAIILAIVALAIIFVVVLKTVPFISKGIDSILMGIKRPICCSMLGCKPAAQQVTQNPGGGFICSAFCWGVCG